MKDKSEGVIAGVVGKPHGLTGAFHVRHPVAKLLSVGMVVSIGDRSEEIVERSGADEQAIIAISGCEDRESAKTLSGKELIVSQKDLPKLPSDEWWAHQLEGCEVQARSEQVGVVKRVLAFPSCEVLEVVHPDSNEVLLIPLISDAVKKVDIDQQKIEVDLDFLGES